MNLQDTLKDIAMTPQEFCSCGEPKSRDAIYCNRCKAERYAERKQHEREDARFYYGPDSARW